MDTEAGVDILKLFGIDSDVLWEINNVNQFAFQAGSVNGSGNAHTHAAWVSISDFVPASAGETVTINGRDFLIGATETFQSFITRVNNTNGIGVLISLNEATGRFSIRPTGMGDGAEMTTDNSALMQFMGLENITWDGMASHNYLPTDPNSRLIQRAQDAEIYYDDGTGLGALGFRGSSNTFEIKNIRIDITTAAEGNIFTVNAQPNVDDIVDMVKDFVESYNNLIRQLHSMHSTARPTQQGSRRNFFEPLTDEQRNAMSDREIERWEEQARIGLLHRDPLIRNLQVDLRRVMFDPIELGDGKRIALFNIGITTTNRDGERADFMAGVLQIDEVRLREAILNDPSDVQALFSRNPHEAGETSRTARERVDSFPNIGVAWRLRHVIENAVIDPDGPFRQRAGAVGWDDGQNLVGRQIRDYDARIERMQQFLIRRENHFFQMFARMEQAMAESHSQMDALFAFAMQ